MGTSASEDRPPPALSDATAAAELSEAAPLRILLLDNSRLFSEVLRRRLLNEPDVSVVTTAATAPGALRLLAEEPFAVVVATAALARELWTSSTRANATPPRIPVIVLADAADRQWARELFRLGVVGWVSRERSSLDLLEAARQCRRGDVCIPMEILTLLTQEQRAPDQPESARTRVLSALTERELEVFMLLEQGMGRAEIASALHLSPNTVRTHIQRILRRLNVHSTLAALALARAGDLPMS